MLYDQIGQQYNVYRRADPRLVAALLQHLPQDPATNTLLEVGAGTGNYSLQFAKASYKVLALEPSKVMREQAGVHENLKWIPHSIEELPENIGAVDAVIAIMSLQHIKPMLPAMQKLRAHCPTGPIIIFTFDPRLSVTHWLYEYFPDLWALAFDAFPALEQWVPLFEQHWSNAVTIEAFPIPRDFCDQFAPTNWLNPQLYLDPNYRKATSGFSLINQAKLDLQLTQLERDLNSGLWAKRYGHFQEATELDLGCRIVVL